MSSSLIIIAGMSRGGTNLLWNIIQSHPLIIDSYYEVNEIFGRKTDIGLIEKSMIELQALTGIHSPKVRYYVKERIKRFAKYSFDVDKYNREKYPGITYEENEFSSLTICTKLVSSWENNIFRKILKRNDALKYIPLMQQSFSNVKVIFLIRDGLAVAEGWGRRGASIQAAGLWYRHYLDYYEKFINKNPCNSIIVRFEDLLASPFKAADDIYKFLNFAVISLSHLRIAIKPTIRSNCDVINTTEKKKVWVTHDNWKDYLDVSINDAQIERISPEKKEQFMNINRSIMERYGYK